LPTKTKLEKGGGRCRRFPPKNAGQPKRKAPETKQCDKEKREGDKSSVGEIKRKNGADTSCSLAANGSKKTVWCGGDKNQEGHPGKLNGFLREKRKNTGVF